MLRLGFLVLLIAACSRDGEPGKERVDPADCTLVGEALASLDLGNYAEPEERTPVVAKYKATCEKARVSKEEGACLDKAKDKWSAAQCASRMFPELASKNTGDCKKVVDKIGAAVRAMQAGSAANPQLAQWETTIARVMQESCEQDRWPDAMKQCVLVAETRQGADALTACNQQMPPALQNKLQQRLQAAIQQQQK